MGFDLAQLIAEEAAQSVSSSRTVARPGGSIACPKACPKAATLVLTRKQKEFVAAYLSTWPNLNGAEAARIAGYSQKNARKAASKQLSKPWVRRVVEEELVELRRRREAKRRQEEEDRRLEEEGRRQDIAVRRKLHAAGLAPPDIARALEKMRMAYGGKSDAKVREMIDRAMKAYGG